MLAATNLSSAGETVRERVAGLRDVLQAHAQEAEDLTYLPQSTIQALHEAGVYKIALPMEYGGHSLGATDQIRILYEAARGDGAAAWSISVASMEWLTLAYPAKFHKEFFETNWVGPRLAGATFSSSHIIGRARQVDGGWMVKGRWSFGSNVRHSCYFGAGVSFDNGARGQVMLSADQYQIIDDWHVMGLSGTGSNSVLVEKEVFVPAHRAITMEQLGGLVMADLSKQHEGLLWKINRLVTLGLGGGASAAGIARNALQSFIEQAKQRSPYGTSYAKLSDAPSVHIVAAKAQAMISAAERLIFHAAEQVDHHGHNSAPLSEEEARRLGFEASYAVNLCDEAVGLLQKTLGSSTAALSNPFQKFMRDLRVLSLHGGVRLDFNAEHHGRALFGLPPLMVGM